MDTYDTPEADLDTRAAINRVIDAYEPILLTPAQAADALPALKALVRQMRHANERSTIPMLSSACRFLSDVAPADGCDLDVWLTERQVAQWSHRWIAEKRNTSTLARHLAQLNRLVKVRSGLPERTTTKVAPVAYEPPYDLDVVGAFVAAQASICPAVSAIVAAGAGAGCVIPEVYRGTLRRDGDRWSFVTADGTIHRVVGGWPLDAELDGVAVDTKVWQRAKRAFVNDTGEVLDRWRLRRTGIGALLGEPRPVAEILGTIGGHQAIDGVVPFLPVVPGPVVDRLLRG